MYSYFFIFKNLLEYLFLAGLLWLFCFSPISQHPISYNKEMSNKIDYN